MQAGIKRNLVWLVIFLAVLLSWWIWRSIDDNGATVTGEWADSAWAGADPDDVLVDLKDDVTDERVAALGAKLGIRLELVSHESRDERLYRAHVPAAERDHLLRELAARSDVELAEPDAEFQLIDGDLGDGARTVSAPTLEPAFRGFPNDPQYKFQWHLRQIGMPQAWKLADGKDVIVAVIDTGVAFEKFEQSYRVPDLGETRFVKPYNFLADNTHANDDHGHGTHVAGTIGQNTNNKIGVAGVAPRVSIMPLKVLSASGSGSLGAIADAIRYAADNGAKVINMSLGGPFPSRILQSAIDYAYKKGVVVVCAAGNNGRGQLSYPAAYPHAFAVAATQYDETTTFYSNWGKGLDIAAPGGNTKVDQNGDGMPDGVLQNTIVMNDPAHDGYFPYMGTSMAAPHVAGVAALVIAEGVTDPGAVETILSKTARKPKNAAYSSERYGAGIVDASAAVKRAKTKKGGLELLLGGLLAWGVAVWTRRRGQLALCWPGYLTGMVVGASGLFFLPLMGDAGAWLANLPVLSTLTHGLPSWDLTVLGPGSHGNLLFFSALAPLLAVAFGYGLKTLRPWLAGLSIGVAAHLVFHLVTRATNITWMPDALDPVWLGVNALVAGALAVLCLKR